MQCIFDCSFQRYIDNNKGKSFSVPYPMCCPYCHFEFSLISYGGYMRFLIFTNFDQQIYIHRFFCKNCCHTISFLPSFCLPKFQYALSIIFHSLVSLLHYEMSISKALDFLISRFKINSLSQQLLSFYFKRFSNNLPFIQLILRALCQNIILPAPSFDVKQTSAKVMNLILVNFSDFYIFASSFFKYSSKSFLDCAAPPNFSN